MAARGWASALALGTFFLPSLAAIVAVRLHRSSPGCVGTCAATMPYAIGTAVLLAAVVPSVVLWRRVPDRGSRVTAVSGVLIMLAVQCLMAGYLALMSAVIRAPR